METRASMLKAIGLGITGATVLATAANAADVPGMGVMKLANPLLLPTSIKSVAPSQELKLFVLVGRGGNASAIALHSSDTEGISKLTSQYKVTPATLFTQGGVAHLGLGGAAAGKSSQVSRVSSEVNAINFSGAGRSLGPVMMQGAP